MNELPLIQYLREQLMLAEESIVRLKEIKVSKNGEEFSKGYRSGKRTMAGDILRKMAELGVSFEPDKSVIAEAENLISKHPTSFYCGHELNRALHYYNESFKAKDFAQAMLNERTIRSAIVRARLESAGLLNGPKR